MKSNDALRPTYLFLTKLLICYTGSRNESKPAKSKAVRVPNFASELGFLDEVRFCRS